MGVRYKENIRKQLKGLSNIPFKIMLENTGVQIIEIIQDRTEKGLNQKGNRFKPYSKKYKKWKKKTGRNTSKVNLEFTGELLRSMFSKVSKSNNEVLVTVSFPKRKHSKSKITIDKLAKVIHFGKGRQPKRAFFGLNKQEEKAITKSLIKKITRAI